MSLKKKELLRASDNAEFIIGPAHRVRPLAGPMAGSGRTRVLNPATKLPRVLRTEIGRH